MWMWVGRCLAEQSLTSLSFRSRGSPARRNSEHVFDLFRRRFLSICHQYGIPQAISSCWTHLSRISLCHRSIARFESIQFSSDASAALSCHWRRWNRSVTRIQVSFSMSIPTVQTIHVDLCRSSRFGLTAFALGILLGAAKTLYHQNEIRVVMRDDLSTQTCKSAVDCRFLFWITRHRHPRCDPDRLPQHYLWGKVNNEISGLTQSNRSNFLQSNTATRRLLEVFPTPDTCRIVAIGISFFYSHGFVVVHSSNGCQYTQAVLHRHSTHRTSPRRSLSTHSTRYPCRVEQSRYLTLTLAFRHLLPCRSSPMVGILSFWWRIDYHFA